MYFGDLTPGINLNNYLSWVHEIVKNRLVNRRQSSAPWSLLFAEVAGVSSGFRENSPFSQEYDVFTGELLLELPDQSPLDLVVETL